MIDVWVYSPFLGHWAKIREIAGDSFCLSNPPGPGRRSHDAIWKQSDGMFFYGGTSNNEVVRWIFSVGATACNEGYEINRNWCRRCPFPKFSNQTTGYKCQFCPFGSVWNPLIAQWYADIVH